MNVLLFSVCIVLRMLVLLIGLFELVFYSFVISMFRLLWCWCRCRFRYRVMRVFWV